MNWFSPTTAELEREPFEEEAQARRERAAVAWLRLIADMRAAVERFEDFPHISGYDKCHVLDALDDWTHIKETE